jgi:hypothetical protein
MSTLEPVNSNTVTVLLMQASIFNRKYLRCYWWCNDNSMRVIPHNCCQMQPKSSWLRYVITGPCEIQYSYSSSYAGFNITLNVYPLRLVVYRKIGACCNPHFLTNKVHNIQFTLRQLEGSVKLNVTADLVIEASVINWTYFRCNCRNVDNSMLAILHLCSQMQPKSSCLRYVIAGPSQIQCNYSSSYAGFNIQLNVSPMRVVVYRQIDACYSPYLMPNTGHNMRCTLCQIWYR